LNRSSYNPYLRCPRLALAATLGLLAVLGLRWFGFEVSTETGTLLEGDQRNLTTYRKVQDILREDVVVVISLHCGPVFTRSGMSLIRQVSEAFMDQPGLLDVKSFTHAVKPVRDGLSFDMVPLVSADPDEAELAGLRRFSLENPLIRNVMVSPDEEHTILLNTYRRDLSRPEHQARFRQEIDAILAPFRAAGHECAVLGLPLIEDEIRRTLWRDLRYFVPAGFLVLLVVLWLTFRSGWVLLLLAALQSFVLLAIPAMVDLAGCRMNLFTAMLFPLLAAVQMTQLIHLFSAWQKARTQASDPDAIMAETLRESLRPSLFAALTTVAGLLALCVSEVRLIREFGYLGALGIGLVFCASFGPGLALMKLVISGRKCFTPALSTNLTSLAASPQSAAIPLGHGQRRSAETPPPGDSPSRGTDRAPWRLPRPESPGRAGPESGVSRSLGSRIHTFWLRRPRVILAAAAAVLAFSGFGLARLRTDVRAAEFLYRRSPTRQAVEEIDRRYGGVNVVQIEVDSGQPDGINGLPFLRYLDSVQRFAGEQPEVSSAYSYAQLLAMMNQLWEQEADGSFRVPENPLLIQLFVLALKSYRAPFLAALADERWQTAYLIVRTRDQPAERYLAVLNRILDFAQARTPPGVTVSAAQGIHTILEADRRILRSQSHSALLTAISMGLILSLLWRSFRLPLLVLTVNLFAVGLVLGLAGWVGITLNSVTAMVAAISLGIAEDNSVHFLTHWREARRAGRSTEQALAETLELKARPIISSGLVLLGVFLVFQLSSFPPVKDFGLLAAGAFAAALGCVLVLLPVLVLVCERLKPRKPTG
jgi:hypothetical protein